MRNDIVKTLFELCNKAKINPKDIEKYVHDNSVTPEELTLAAIRLVDKNMFEIKEAELFNSHTPSADELVSTNFITLFEIFIRHGLLPNYIHTDDGINYHNIMDNIRDIDNVNVAFALMKMLMGCGGDPNLEINGESLFSEVDFDLLFCIREFTDESVSKKALDKAFRIWLILTGYGGYINKQQAPVNMRKGYTPEIFRAYEDFNYRIEYNDKDFKMYIYNIKTNDEIANL